MDCQLFESWAVFVQSDGSYRALSPVVHGDIVLSTNTNTTACKLVIPFTLQVVGPAVTDVPRLCNPLPGRPILKSSIS